MPVEYLAGFFDGEGSIGIYRGGQNGRTLRVQITQVREPESDKLLDELHSRWGGSLCEMNRGSDRKSLAWIWQLSGARACAFLEWILPHLRLKQEQAELAVGWYRSRPAPTRNERGHIMPTTPEQRRLDDKADAALRALKSVNRLGQADYELAG